MHDYVVTGGVSACDELKCVVTTLFSWFSGLELPDWQIAGVGNASLGTWLRDSG